MYVILELICILSFFILIAIPTNAPSPPIAVQTAPTQLQQERWGNSVSSKSWLQQKITLAEQPNERWWAQYKLAQHFSKNKQSQKACQLFSQLSLEKSFPIHSVATLRALELCDTSSPYYGQLEKTPFDQIDPWLKEISINSGLKKAEERKDLFEVMKLSYEKSKQALPKNQKIKHTQRALELALEMEQIDFSKSMKARLDRLKGKSKDLTKASLLQTAQNFQHQRDFKKAVDVYTQIIKKTRIDFMTKYKAYVGIRRVAKLELKTEAYIKATENLADFVQSKYLSNKKPNYALIKRYHDTQLTLAKTYWTKNRTEQTIKTLKATKKHLKGRYSLEKIYFILGRIEDEKQNFKAAAWWFTESLKQPPVYKSHSIDTYWFKAWNLRKAGQFKEAIIDFQELLKRTKDSSIIHRTEYWLGKSLQNINQTSEANEIFSALSSKDRVGFYGLLASRELGENLSLISMVQRNLASLEDATDTSVLVHHDYIQWLLAVSEKQIAGFYLHNLSVKMRLNKVNALAEWMDVFKYYIRSEQYNAMYSDLGQLNPKLRQTLLDFTPEIFFPRPYYKTVKEVSVKFGLTPSMIYAIIRQESAFNPKARSHADAFGLMQLLPQVAQYTSDRHKLKYNRALDLYKPEINIPLGTAFLKELFNKHEGQFILAVASYNASEKAIEGWMKTRYRGDSLEFIEDIPYSETRSYVRLVMRNFIYYEMLESAPNNIAFPEWALDLTVASR